jgi:flagellar basal body-associated protein FliL
MDVDFELVMLTADGLLLLMLLMVLLVLLALTVLLLVVLMGRCELLLM